MASLKGGEIKDSVVIMEYECLCLLRKINRILQLTATSDYNLKYSFSQHVIFMKELTILCFCAMH